MIQDAVTMTAYSALLGIRLSEIFRLSGLPVLISTACAKDFRWTVLALLIRHKMRRKERQDLAGLVGGFTATEPKGNSMKLTGNTILLTGGTSGIGRALAEALHDRGNHVIVTGRRQALLDEMTNARPGLVGLQLDVDDAASLAQLSAQMRERFPQLNVLIANAGISRTEDIASDGWTANDAEAIVQTNILGVLRVAAAILPLLKGKPNAAFLATSSALAFVPRADFPTYCASKAFLHSWLQSLRHQMRGFPIEVLELSPPYVQTGLTGPHQIDDPRAMPLPDYVAEVLRMLETGDTPRGEVLLERDLPRRWAERDGGYDAMFALMNPA
jgi:uncharacterized oxidoreductase